MKISLSCAYCRSVLRLLQVGVAPTAGRCCAYCRSVLRLLQVGVAPNMSAGITPVVPQQLLRGRCKNFKTDVTSL